MKTKWYVLITAITITSASCSQEHRLITDITYTDSQISTKQKLDVYIPESDTLMPCLIWIHGGAWLAGSKDGLAQEIDTLLYHRYVIVSIGYRLSTEAIFPAQINDCKAAIRFIKKNSDKYQIDSSRIAVAGASAGGHLAALVGTSSGLASLEDKSLGSENASCTIKAVIDYYGPTDFLIMDELPAGCKDPMIHLEPNSPESLLLGCNIQDCPEQVKAANPITYITVNDPPFLIFHGTSDCTVTPNSSILLKKELENKGIDAELHLLPDAGHGGKEFVSPEIKGLVLNFLDRILK